MTARVRAIGAAIATMSLFAGAQDPGLPSGLEVVTKANSQNEGDHVSRTIHFVLTDRRDKTREQTARAFHKFYDDDKRSVIFYTDPKNIEGTAFLTYDYASTDTDDDQWLYLPAMRKVRRISSSNRGDYFLGTDLTYDDMKRETKVTIEDYNWNTLREEPVNDAPCYVVEATPKSPEIGKELGYSRAEFYFDQDTGLKRRTDFWDTGGNPLKTIRFLGIKQIDGIWTMTRLECDNLKTGHKTVLEFSDIDYEADVDDDLFSERALARGL